jgi:hypothetical protein
MGASRRLRRSRLRRLSGARQLGRCGKPTRSEDRAIDGGGT